MVNFKRWLEDLEHAVRIHLPSVRQGDSYDCGSACLRSVCEFFKVGPEDQKEFIKSCKSDKKKGTKPEDIIRAARSFGLSVKPVHGMKIEQLKQFIDLERPVIVCMQAWDESGEKEKSYNKLEMGHYVVAIGHDDDKIYFEDPMMAGERGSLPHKEFMARWHDKDAEGKVYNRFGIVLWKPMGFEKPEEQKLSKDQKIP